MFWRHEALELARIHLNLRVRSETQAIILLKNHFMKTLDPVSGLRIHKPVATFHVDWSRFEEINILDGGQEECANAINRVNENIMSVCGLQIMEAPIDVADNVYRFIDVDGPGGILAFVPLPTTGDNVEACWDCGNMYFDTAKTCFVSDFFNITQHETGHVYGIGHGPEGSVMGPTYEFDTPELALDHWTRLEYVKRYRLPGI